MPRPELAGHRTKCFSGLNQDRKFSHRTGTMNFQNFEPAQTDRFLLHFTYVCLHMYVFFGIIPTKTEYFIESIP